MFAAMALIVYFEVDFTRSEHHIATLAPFKLCEPQMTQGKAAEMMKIITIFSILTALGIVNDI